MASMILSYIATFAIIIVILKIIALPFKIILKLAINTILGGIILYILVKVGIAITITWWMAAIVAILGIPGAIIVAILNFVL